MHLVNKFSLYVIFNVLESTNSVEDVVKTNDHIIKGKTVDCKRALPNHQSASTKAYESRVESAPYDPYYGSGGYPYNDPYDPYNRSGGYDYYGGP